MATFVKRGNKVRAVVRKVGMPAATKSFDSMRDAKAWAAAEETKLTTRVVDAGGLTLGQIMGKYLTRYQETRAYTVQATQSLYRRFERDFANVEIAQMNTQWWLDTVESWSHGHTGKTVNRATARRYLTYITTALKTSKRRWNVTVDWAAYHEALDQMKDDKTVGSGRSRTRRLQPGELEKMQAFANTMTTHIPFADIMDFAIASTMRIGEILRLEWRHVNDLTRTIVIKDRKDPQNKEGNDQEIPLLNGAYDILQRQKTKGKHGKIFPYYPNYFCQRFGYICEQVGIEDFHFHDFRHEGISRLFEQGYQIDEVAMVSGHKKWDMLRKYTHRKAADLHRGPSAQQRKGVKAA
jgi:integrase